MQAILTIKKAHDSDMLELKGTLLKERGLLKQVTQSLEQMMGEMETLRARNKTLNSLVETSAATTKTLNATNAALSSRLRDAEAKADNECHTAQQLRASLEDANTELDAALMWKEDVEDLQNDLEESQKLVASNASKVADGERRLAESEKKLRQMSRALDMSVAQIDALQQENLRLKEDLAASRTQQDKEIARLAKELKQTKGELRVAEIEAQREADLATSNYSEAQKYKADLRTAQLESVLHELSREKGVTLTLERELGAGSFGQVVAVSFDDPHSGARRSAAAKIADSSGINSLINDAESLGALAATGCNAAVPLVLGGACELSLPGGKRGAAYLMEEAKGNLVDECEAMRSHVAWYEAKLSDPTSQLDQADIRDSARDTWEELHSCTAAFAANHLSINAVGMLHCDIKPDNSLIMADGSVLACDFGSALWDEDAALWQTILVDGVEVSTPLWSFYEQVIATTAAYEQPEELYMQPEHIGLSFDSWASIVSVLEMVGLGPMELIGRNNDSKYKRELVGAIRAGSIRELVADGLARAFPTCPADIAGEIADVVERSAKAHHCYGCK
eukprot:jgi/Tetstr1/440828/TSEL_029135.t1